MRGRRAGAGGAEGFPPRAVEGETASGEVIAGRQPVREALRAGRPLHRVLIRRGGEGSLRELVALAREAGVVVQTVDGRRLDALAAGVNHQGVVAIPLARGYLDLEDVLERIAGTSEPGLILVLDGVQDPRNLGSLLRSAEATGVHGVILPKRRSAGLTPAAVKASAGASEHVPIVRVTNLVRAIERLQEAGFWVVGADASAADLAWDTDLSGPVALVVGGEGDGISRLVREYCDRLVRFPMMGRVSSLNAGVAGALLLYEIVRQRYEAAKRATSSQVPFLDDTLKSGL